MRNVGLAWKCFYSSEFIVLIEAKTVDIFEYFLDSEKLCEMDFAKLGPIKMSCWLRNDLNNMRKHFRPDVRSFSSMSFIFSCNFS